MKSNSDYLKVLRQTSLDMASSSNALLITYCLFSLYLGITYAQVSHTDLLIGGRLTIPVLDIELPLVSFFLFSLLIYTSFHIFVLMNIYKSTQLSEKYISMSLRKTETNIANKNISTVQAQILFSSPFEISGYKIYLTRVYCLNAFFITSLLPAAIGTTCIVVFLPYHDEFTSNFQRIAVLISSFASIIFAIRLGGYTQGWFLSITCLTHILLAAFISTMAVYPGEMLYKLFHDTDKNPFLYDEEYERSLVENVYNRLFIGTINEATGDISSLFSARLVITDYFQQKSDTDSRDESTLSLRGRDFRGAFLPRADFRYIDMTGVDLRFSNLKEARLDGAIFKCANTLQVERGDLLDRENQFVKSLDFGDDTNDGCAWLERANLLRARMDGADFSGARLFGAYMPLAQLRGANFYGASLQGAYLRAADLAATQLVSANLSGAHLEHAYLFGTDFHQANLELASFRNSFNALVLYGDAQTEGADFSGSQFLFSETKNNLNEYKKTKDEVLVKLEQLNIDLNEGPFRDEEEFEDWFSLIPTFRWSTQYQTKYIPSNIKLLNPNAQDEDSEYLSLANYFLKYEGANVLGTAANARDEVIEKVLCSEGKNEYNSLIIGLLENYFVTRDNIRRFTDVSTCPSATHLGDYEHRIIRNYR